jgi:hypothetical protein
MLVLLCILVVFGLCMYWFGNPKASPIGKDIFWVALFILLFKMNHVPGM